MANTRKIYLLLWKNFTLHRRHKLRLFVEIILPLFLFVILMILRKQGHRYDMPECHFDQKAMPSTGFWPFFQSICTFNNTCHPDERNQVVLESVQTSLHFVNNVISDIENITKNHITETKLKKFATMFRDLEAFSKLLRILTDPYSDVLGMLNVSVIFDNVVEVVNSIENLNISLSSDSLQTLLTSHIKVSGIQALFDLQRLSVYAHLCQRDGISNLIYVENRFRWRHLKIQLCSLSTTEGSSLIFGLLKQINWKGFYEQVSNVTFLNVGQHPPRTDNFFEVIDIVNSIVKEVSDMSSLSYIRDKVISLRKTKNSTETAAIVGEMFQTFICGRNSSVIFDPDNQGVEKKFEELKEQMKKLTKGDRNGTSKYSYDNATNSKCNALFEFLETNENTFILWQMFKPFIRGKILFTPVTKASNKIIEKMNETFHGLVETQQFLKRIADSLSPMSALEMEDESSFSIVQTVEDIISQINAYLESSDAYFGYTRQDFFDMFVGPNLEAFLEFLIYSSEFVENIQDYIECIDVNRFQGYSTEMEMTRKGFDLIKGNNFFAGIVFDNLGEGEELPKYVKYKIRMDSKKVTSSKRLFDFFSKPGPRRRPTVDLKYLTFGFSYLQDLIEHTIINLQTENEEPVGVYLQQFPYPCYISDQFLFLISLNFAFFMTVAWLYSCSMIVKGIVLEKQQRLKEVMKIMGLENGILWLAWFIEAILIMVISCILIACIFVYGGILERSNPLIVFLYLIAYCVSTVSISFLMSTWFSNANIASVASGSIFFLLYLPNSFLNKHYEGMSNWNKFFSGFLPASSFGLGAIYITHLEENGEGAQWNNFMTSNWPDDRFSLAHCIGMLILDSVVFMLLALYIEAVFPGQYGIPQPWYYFVTKSYWCGSLLESKEVVDKNTLSYLQFSDDFEEEPTDLSLGVSIQSLSKRYSKHDKLAVDNLSLNFYENQITSFLGENGAGKTTTISMLIGLYPPTSGIAYVNGYSITEDMDAVRRSMGVCPQYNVLFDDLTVMEHLWFYGRLKGANNEDVKKESEQLIIDLGLENKRNELACDLSGGMQRKLSIGIAFTAGSKTVILDEPTAGVDPYARRAIWELLLKYKNGRTIILTTHHMDEADLLGDRIAIIANGKLSCCGSSLFLKSRYGRGYYLTMVKADKQLLSDGTNGPKNEEQLCESGDYETAEDQMGLFKKENAEDAAIKMEWFVKNYINDAELVENVGADMTFLISKNNQEDGSLLKLLENLEKHQKYLPISSYGISDSSFQEVFLRISDSAKENLKYNVNTNANSRRNMILFAFINFLSLVCQCVGYRKKPSTEVETRLTAPPSPSKQVTGKSLYWQQFYALIIRRLHHSKRNYKGLFCEIALPAFFVCLSMVLSEFTPGYSEEPPIELHPWHYEHNFIFFENENLSSQSSKSYIESLLSRPGLGNRCVRDNPIEGFECNPASHIKYKALEPNYNFTFANKVIDCSCSSGSMKCPEGAGGPSPPSVETNSRVIVFNATGRNISDWLLKTTKKFYKRRFGGFSFGISNPVSHALEDFVLNISDRLVTPLSKKYNLSSVNDFTRNLTLKIRNWQPINNIKVWFNNHGWISSVTFLNLANNIILRSKLGPDKDPKHYGISVTNHPMHYAEEQIEEIVQDFGDLGFLYSICIIFALSLVPASFLIFLIDEKSSGSKHLQYVSGLKPFLYYLSAFVWDIMMALILVGLFILIFLAFNEQAFVSTNHFPGFSALLIMFCLSCIPLMYMASFLFNSAGSAFVTLSSVNIFIGVLTTISIYILHMLDNEVLEDLAAVLEKVFLIFPHFGLGNGLMSLYHNHLYTIAFAEYGIDASKNPFSWDFLGLNLFIMSLQSVIFFIIVLFIEYGLIRVKSYSISSKEFHDDNFNNCDNDVLHEMQKTRYAKPKDYSLLIRDLVKSYHPKKPPAVNKLCLSVESGQCFGLLGKNGAGKTSTFHMLTGKTSVTSGDAFIGGYSIKSDLEQARQVIGFCPQFDALDSRLTAVEHLEFYARISGIPEKHIRNTAFWGIRKLGLSRYANITAGTYSGGNKRKLSTAIALIGYPAVIFLDEPTTGMDPHSRRFLWNCIIDVVKDGHCVILTSHSMEECEALCTKLAIMSNGQFRCIGSIQHLKNKYGTGYTVTLKAFNENQVVKVMEETFDNRASLRETHLNQLQYQLHSSLKLSFIFRQLEEFRKNSLIETYSVTQTTLEQVFINFAKEPNDASVSLPNEITPPVRNQSYPDTEESSPELKFLIKNGEAVYAMDRETVV